MRSVSWISAVAAAIVLALGAGQAQAAQFELVILDDANEGLNDPESRSPVGGNSGTTLGEQRQIVLEAAAEAWAEVLDLSVDLLIGASFPELDCEETSGILGSAGPAAAVINFSGAPQADTLYTIAQANTITGQSSLDQGEVHIFTQYNAQLDEGSSGCLGGNTWYYGLDGNPPGGTIALFPVVLHELAHGLGFLTFVDLETGALAGPAGSDGFEDAYMQFLRDTEEDLDWTDMSDALRAESATNDPHVVWTGPIVDEQSSIVTSSDAFSDDRIRMHAPEELRLGSSISHWTPDAHPPLLMEPSLQAGVFNQLDLTPALFEDIGWPMSGGVIFRDRFEQ